MHTQTSYDLLFDKRREEHLKKTRALFTCYMEQSAQEKTDQLISFTGWPEESSEKSTLFSLADHKLLFGPHLVDEQKGGYYLCLEQNGICINPGKDFFSALTASGKTLFDIDVVICSRKDRDLEEALKEIHTLNRELNRTLLSYEQEPHVIRYLLHPTLYSALSAELRPEFREERHSIITLETFGGGATEETYQIADSLSFAYTKTANANLGIRFSSPKDSIGFLLGANWQESLQPFFASCSLMVLGIGKTSAEDLEKVALHTDSLGYFGCFQCIQAQPRAELVLVSEFSRQNGDIRLELVKKLAFDVKTQAKLLPIDAGFCLDLNTKEIEVSSQKTTPYQEVHALRPQGSFAKLIFIGVEDFI